MSYTIGTALIDAPGVYIIRNAKAGNLYIGSSTRSVKRSAIPEGGVLFRTCDNDLCVNPDHMFLGTKADTAAVAISHGRGGRGGARGEAHGHAKLSLIDVEEIRNSASTQKELSRRYGVDRSEIGRIKQGKAWRE